MDGTTNNGCHHYPNKEKKMYKWVKKLLEPCPYGLIEKLCDKYTTTNDSFIGIIFSPLGRSLSRIRGIRDHDINKLSRR